jgi:hypothetical protein
MKLKKIHSKLLMFLILTFNSTLIVYGQKDSIKFSIEESRALIDAYLNYPLCLELNDSCEVKNKILARDLIAVQELNKYYKETKEVEQEFRKESLRYSKELETKLNDANKWKYFWRRATGFISLIGGTLITYNYLSK